MQLLEMFTARFPIYRRSESHAWVWPRGLAVLGASCSIASITLYIYASTMWSALFPSLVQLRKLGWHFSLLWWQTQSQFRRKRNKAQNEYELFAIMKQ